MNERLPIIIQGAMQPELEILIENLNTIERININGYDFYKGEIYNYPIIISKTDVGVINVTASTITAINNFSPIYIINQGIAGAIDEKVHKGDIVIGEKCININSYQTPFLGKGEGSNSLNWELKTFKEGIDELVEINCDIELLEIIKKYLENNEVNNISKNLENTENEESVEKIEKIEIVENVQNTHKSEIKNIRKENIKFGIIGSGDVWNGEYDKMKMLNEKYNIICEDMETIGVYQICKRLNTKVIGIRAISDNAILGEEYERKIGTNSQKFTLEILKEIINKIDNKL